MQLGKYRTETALPAAADQLAAIRVEAMRPSLEAVGRFDPLRAKERFLSTFAPEETEVIHLGARIVGFYVLRKKPDHLYLDHLYIVADMQGSGIGRMIIDALKQEARSCGLPIRLMALNGSPAHDFYKRRGFGIVTADALDTIFEWHPDR